MGIYYEDNNIFYQEGNIPVVMTFPHSGLSLIDGVEVRKKGIIDGDCFTDLFANYMVQMFNCIGCNCCMKDVDNCGGCTDATACCCDSVAGIPDYNTFEFNSQCLRPFIIYSKIDRKHCDFNRAKEVAYEDQRLADIYDQYHRTINEFVSKATKLVGGDHTRVLLMDMHGQSDLRGHILRGTRNLKTVQPMLKRFGVQSLIGEHSLLGYIHNRGIPVFPTLVPLEYDNNQKPIESPKSSKLQLDPYLEHPHYSGGYTVHNYSQKQPINCIQLEFGFNLRNKDDQRMKAAKIVRDAVFEFYNHYLKNEKE